MRGKRLLQRLQLAFSKEPFQVSYSQCGEDLVMRAMFGLLGIERPTYLDIGANHPTELSNTYLFYRMGSRGVCVEPDPNLIAAFRSRRPGDKILNIGIAPPSDAKELTFYAFDDPTLSTFSEAVRDDQLAAGRKIEKQLAIPVRSINAVLETEFQSPPNLVSLDTEGMDLEILRGFDFNRFRPAAFCIETLTNQDERKMPEILDFMAANEYTVYGDTYINTIFVDRHRWNRRLESGRGAGHTTHLP